jgi:hypothetical protein
MWKVGEYNGMEERKLSEQDDERFLTSAEALEFLGIRSMSSLKRYVDDGWIRKYKARIGREPLYKLSELQELKEVRPVREED